MYPNLRAEIARKGLTVTSLARLVGMNRQTLETRLLGRSEFRFSEAKKIRDTLGINMPYDELFKYVEGEEK